MGRVRRGAGARWPTPAQARNGLERELAEVEIRLATDPGAHAAWSNGVDVPGEAYETLLIGAARRELGQFQTPFLAADIMAGWLLAKPVRTLLDPGVGTGRLLFRSAMRSGAAIGRMVGIDVDELALSMATLNLSLRDSPADLLCGDFLADDDALDRIGLLAAPPDGVISNPPFSRHQALTGERKTQLRQRAQERLGLKLNGRTGLHAYFLLRALEITSENARLAFITPAGWLDVDYGKPIKRYLTERAHIEAVVLFGSRHQLFPKATTTAAITLISKRPACRRPTRVIHAGKQIDVDEMLAAIAGEKTRLRTDTTTLTRERRWSAPAPRGGRGTPLSEVARVRRGIATGNNAFFVISERERLEWHIETSHVRSCLYRPRLFAGDVITDEILDALDDDVRRWVLSSPHADHEQRDDGLGAYLRWGKEECAADESYLASHRPVWHQPEQRDACGIVLPYMNRDLPRFIRNPAAAVPLNTFHVVEPIVEDATEALWRALSQPEVLRRVKRLGRDYGRGLWKIEPGALGELRVNLD